MMKFYELTLRVLCVWRLSPLLAAEDGPWGIFARLRLWVCTGLLGELMDCFDCLSLWISTLIIFLFQGPWKERVLLWLACSAGAILLERLTSPEHNLLGPLYGRKGAPECVVTSKGNNTSSF
jgi:hypothetical protein